MEGFPDTSAGSTHVRAGSQPFAIPGARAPGKRFRSFSSRCPTACTSTNYTALDRWSLTQPNSAITIGFAYGVVSRICCLFSSDDPTGQDELGRAGVDLRFQQGHGAAGLLKSKGKPQLTACLFGLLLLVELWHTKEARCGNVRSSILACRYL